MLVIWRQPWKLSRMQALHVGDISVTKQKKILRMQSSSIRKRQSSTQQILCGPIQIQDSQRFCPEIIVFSLSFFSLKDKQQMLHPFELNKQFKPFIESEQNVCQLKPKAESDV